MSSRLAPDQLVELAEKYGTPLFVYHAEAIQEQFAALTKAFAQSGARFFYACKALTNIHILEYIRSLGCQADCSSINEVYLARRAGFEARQILYTSNNIDFREIEMACQEGVNVHIDSLSNLEKFGKKYGSGYPLGIRLRPNILAGGNLKISTGHSSSKFGIPLEKIGELIRAVKDHHLHVHSLHIHTGSDIQDVEVFARGIELLFEVARHFPHLSFLDLGGGFKVSYQPGDGETDIQALGKKCAEEFSTYESISGKHLEPWFEPGKFLVSRSGYLLARVTVLKESPSTTFAGLDTGLNHFIRPMFYGAYHQIENLSHPAASMQPYTVVGNICETDTFAEDRLLPEIREGDVLALLNAGAYGYEMASNYNSRLRPAEVLVERGQARLIRKRETLEDLLRNQLGLQEN
jgi:diaminopimelate decarboxylase